MLEIKLKKCCRTCVHSDIFVKRVEDYYGDDYYGFTCYTMVSEDLDGCCELYEPIDLKYIIDMEGEYEN